MSAVSPWPNLSNPSLVKFQTWAKRPRPPTRMESTEKTQRSQCPSEAKARTTIPAQPMLWSVEVKRTLTWVNVSACGTVGKYLRRIRTHSNHSRSSWQKRSAFSFARTIIAAMRFCGSFISLVSSIKSFDISWIGAPSFSGARPEPTNFRAAFLQETSSHSCGEVLSRSR